MSVPFTVLVLYSICIIRVFSYFTFSLRYYSDVKSLWGRFSLLFPPEKKTFPWTAWVNV